MTTWRKPEPSEFQIQTAFFEWIQRQAPVIKELAFIYAVPNGEKRHIVTARKLKAVGVKAGVPDVQWPLARGGYHGMYLEFKTRKGKISDEQDHFLRYLEQQGYYATIVRSADQAREEVLRYFHGKTVSEDGGGRADALESTDNVHSHESSSMRGSGDAPAPSNIQSRRYEDLGKRPKQLHLMPEQLVRVGGKIMVRR